jgi:DNA-binding response OmpR family regulator
MLDAAYLLHWSPRPPVTLLADADESRRHECSTFLTHSGCTVDEVDDGRVALAKALHGNVDVLVVEQNLPGIDAARLSAVLRSDPTTASIHIVVTMADEGHVASLRSSGADAIVVGAALPQTLALEMQRVLAQSTEVRAKATAVRQRAREQLARSAEALERSLKVGGGRPMSRAHSRARTQSPALLPPSLPCPSCDRSLHYEYSHTGGVNATQSEQWDYYECRGGCGTFQFRHRTNKLRRVN